MANRRRNGSRANGRAGRGGVQPQQKQERKRPPIKVSLNS